MIFVTVGSQLPFDRLVAAIDTWAATNGNREIFAQIGTTSLRPASIQFEAHLPPDRFNAYFEASEFVVSHAGMGTILRAIQTGKQLIVMPRRYNAGEHRNDHQSSLVPHLTAGNIHIAYDNEDLWRLLSEDGLRKPVQPRNLNLSPQLHAALVSVTEGPHVD